jgi:hypothetical protein
MTRLGLTVLVALAGCCSKVSGSTTGGGSRSGGSSTSGGTTGSVSDECPTATFGVSSGPLTARTSLGAAFGSDGLAYVAGGTIFDGGATALVEVVNPDSGTVGVGPPMLAPRSAFALVASPDRGTLYAIGGFEPDGATATAESFDIATQTWSPLPSLPNGGGPTFAGVLMDGRVVAIVPGALGPDGGSSVEILGDGGWQAGPEILATWPWDELAGALPGPDAAIHVVDSQLNVLAWDPAADAGIWKLIATHEIPGSLNGLAFAQGGQLLLATGGIFEGGDCVEPFYTSLALDLADLDAGWIGLAQPRLSPNNGAAAVSSGQRMFVFGGEQSYACCTGHSEELSRTYLGSYDVFDLDTGAWEPTHGVDGG